MRAPIGYVHEGNKGLVFDPDQQIYAAVQMLFETFRSRGSAEQVVRHFQQQAIRWPRRLVTGPRAGEVIWDVLEHSRVLSILHNPRYAGAYVYGRSRQQKRGGHVLFRRLPRQQWKVFIPNAHPAYIPWEEFEAHQRQLLENANGYGSGSQEKSPSGRHGTPTGDGRVRSLWPAHDGSL